MTDATTDAATAFAIDADGGTGRYAAGLLTLPDGRARGVETVTALHRAASERTGADLLGALRGVLPAGRLPLPLRLAVSTVRAGLGVIEEGLHPDRDAPVPVEIAFADGTRLHARMPAALAAAMERDRTMVRAALERAAPASADPEAAESGPVAPAGPEAPRSEGAPDAPTEPLTSIFRYEKRNGRLRRVSAGGDPPG